jgi:hypothetical protein
MNAIRNPHLLRALIQRVPRGVRPSRTITAPEPDHGEVHTVLSEDERMAQFERSRATVNGRVPNQMVPRNRSLVPVSPAASATTPPLAQEVAGLASHG